jgi:ubiquitin carboxyl-terminal hydrolase 34
MDYDEGESFCKLRDWIESYLAFTQDRPDTWYESFSRYRPFWVILPDIVWALSYRK